MEHQSTEPKIVQGKTGDEFLAELESRPETHDAAEAWRAVLRLADDVEKRGGALLVIGGAVRDEVMGVKAKDFDVEIYHLPTQEIEELALRHGAVKETGKKFAVLKLRVGRSEIDIAAPRRETKTGTGYKGFHVEVDPMLGVGEASRRRDFTMNALSKNPLTGEIIDYHGGLDDIANKKLRVIDPAKFVEDSVRVLRAIQFLGRFPELQADPETKKLLRETAPSLAEQTLDRLRMEWEKLFIKGVKPSAGLQLAKDIGLFEKFPAIQQLSETQQNPEFHPEGDVWTHTKIVVDNAATIAQRYNLRDYERVILLTAALGHDVGKSVTTTNEDGRIRSNGHDMAGVEPMERWMTSQGYKQTTIARVLPLIREHMNPAALYKIDQTEGLGRGPIRRLADRLHPATIRQLIALCEADHTGRGDSTESFPVGPWLLQRAEELAIIDKKPEPIVSGQSLRDLGYPQGLVIGEIMRTARGLADEKNMTASEISEIIKKHNKPEDALKELRSLL